MKKQKKSTTDNLTPSVSNDSLSNMPELPSVEYVTRNIAVAKDREEDKPPQTERNKRKRETAKGTILQAVMIEKDLLKKVKHSAFYNEKSLSEVINQALRLFFD